MRVRIFILSCFMALTAGTAWGADMPQQDSTSNYEQQYRKELDHLLFVSGNRTAMSAIYPQLMTMMRQQLKDVPDAVFNQLENKFRDIFLNKITDLLLPVYQRYLSIDDLRAYAAFYETEVGKKVAMSMPLLQKESMEVGVKAGQELGVELFKELQKQGYDPTKM